MENKSFKDTLLRGIALLGLILILVLGAWGIIVLAFNVPNFLSSAGTTVAGLFSHNEDTVEVPVVATSTEPAATSGSASTSGNAKTAATSPKSTYTPAATPATQLYGLPDLAVRIVSLVPTGNRYSMQFEISNVGTNVATAGWVFTALLPLDPTYTYTSGPQQALRPGDKIVYTLGFDAPYYNNYNDYRYPYDNYNNDRVTVVIDPFLRLYEGNRYNNTATRIISYNYYPTYPQYPYYPYTY